MNTPNDTANAEDFEALYLAYRAKYEAVQAKLDELMLEYCPDEMTPEQIAEWARNQVPCGGDYGC